jgi:hypothetical protein
VLAAERLHGDDTTVPVLAKDKTVIGRVWAYVRDDRPFAGPDPPAALFFYSRNRNGEHPNRHLAGYAGILQADAYAGFGDLYDARRRPGPITEAACWSRGRRKFFVLADLGKSPLAVEAVRRIDEVFARSNARSTVAPPSSGSCSARNGSGRSSASSKGGCAPNAPGCRVTPTSPRRWITCSSAGPPSPAFSTTAASACRTTLPSALCAGSLSGAAHGCSLVPTVAASERLQCTP